MFVGRFAVPDCERGSGTLIPVGIWTLRPQEDVGVTGEMSAEPCTPFEVSSSFTAWATYGNRVLATSVSFSAVACEPRALASLGIAEGSA